MKKYLCVCIVVLLITTLAFSGCSVEKEPRVQDLPIKNMGGYLAKNPENLNDLEEWSTCIVKGVLADDAVNHDEMLNDPVYGDSTGFTSSTLTITETFKGDLSPGDQVAFVEPYFVKTNKKGETYIVAYCGYTPAIPGQEYVFFLDPSESPLLGGEYYEISFPERSRYAVPSKNEIEPLGLNNQEEEGTYQRLYKQVIDKYVE
ncbi:hypothetical protein [Anaeromassilibacillus senegalensis]|uniref:hypothetical protein n=1 Tax=Anaeromassilibacillus senegalensis TaxID=1673717 RepID=UPI0006828614|nr:hypothetical protein [Anaeromassilibacillus senegalensis]